MSLRMLLSSPLAATAGVLAGLGLLALPLRKLTSAEPVRAAAVSEPLSGSVPSWLTLKLLAPAKSVTLKTASGVVLWQLAETPAGDVETQAALAAGQDGLDLMLSVDFGANTAETAVFLTIAPDGFEERTMHAIGSGSIEEPMHFSWHEH